MPGTDEQQMDGPHPAAQRRFWPRRWRTRIGGGAAALVLISGSAAWLQREQIASDVIDDYLAASGVPATYDIVAIGPRVQVIENLVIGDPARPDLTVRRLIVELGVGWAGPEARRVTVDGARAFGTYRNGSFSLGALDPLLFTDSAAPPSLPAINVTLTDARAKIDSEFGAIGLSLEGAGRLDDGFAGRLAATAPGIGIDDCRMQTATLYGRLTTSGGVPQLDGPLRLGGAICAGARLARADIGTRLTLKRDFTGAEADLRIRAGGLTYRDLASGGLGGSAQITWSQTGLALAHDLALSGVTAPQGRLAQLSAEGAWRGAADASRGQWEGRLRGAGLMPAGELATSLAAAERGVEGTLAAPLLAKARAGLARGLDGAELSAEAIIRHGRGDLSLIVPDATITSARGTRVLAASRINARIGADGLSALRGNLLAGGEGLPDINGRIEQAPGGQWTARLAMSEYADGANRLAIPRLTLRQDRGGTIRFDGLLQASGDLPGGRLSDLNLPVDGAWSAARGLTLGPRCLPLRFAALEVSGLALRGQAITLCPDRSGAPMLSYGAGLTLAARTGPISLAGTVGDNPATLAASALRLRYPAPFALEGLSARIGAAGSAVRVSAASLTGSLDGAIAGEFGGGAAQMDIVPLDLTNLSGRWQFVDGALRVDDAAFILADRPEQGTARFKPLSVNGARLQVADSVISADGTLRHAGSGRMVATAAIAHDLENATGRAQLTMPGLVFDKSLQPEDLSELAKGVIAFADGTVTGMGRIDWTADDITSSGVFASKGIDFAAAFGPVRGLSGTVAFTDLLNLTTARDQRVTIAAINPGIEVLDGTVQFEIRDGTLLSLEDARFPFMGGQLLMRPLDMDFSQPEERRYVFEITGLDAATFVTQMELTNLGATGVFDGTVPIIFDKDGNGRIEGGLLLSRPPGGNVAYIGELTYEDLGTMGNYAFSALRSMDYTQMQVGLSGSLAGEIITNFDFDGVRQGAGTSQNFITRRLAKLPIRFKINVRAENFYELTTMVRSFWDVDFLGNPIDRGLIRAQDGRFVPARPASPAPIPPPVPIQTPIPPPGGKPVQPSESEDQP